MAGMVGYAGISFGTYETLKEITKEKNEILYCVKTRNENGEINWYIYTLIGKPLFYRSTFLIELFV